MNILHSFNNSYEYNTSDKDYQIDNKIINYSGCSSDIYFGNTSYTLSFGHLFSGNLHCYPNSLNKSLHMVNIQSQQNPIINHKVNEAMKTIRKTNKNIEKQYNYSIPSVPYCYNSIMPDCNQNKGGILLERTANTISRLK